MIRIGIKGSKWEGYTHTWDTHICIGVLILKLYIEFEVAANNIVNQLVQLTAVASTVVGTSDVQKILNLNIQVWNSSNHILSILTI